MRLKRRYGVLASGRREAVALRAGSLPTMETNPDVLRRAPEA